MKYTFVIHNEVDGSYHASRISGNNANLDDIKRSFNRLLQSLDTDTSEVDEEIHAIPV